VTWSLISQSPTSQPCYHRKCLNIHSMSAYLNLFQLCTDEIEELSSSSARYGRYW